MSLTLSTAVRALAVLAAVLSLLLARRRPDFRPVAAFLAVVAARAIARGLLRAAVPELAAHRVPASVSRLALDVDLALHLVWPAAVVALALAVCLGREGRRAWPAVLAWVVGFALLGGFALRSAVALEVGALLEAGALAFAAGAIVQWSGRGRVPRLPQVALVLVVTFDGLAFVATRGGPSGDTIALWPSALSCFAVLFAALSLLAGGALCRR